MGRNRMVELDFAEWDARISEVLLAHWVRLL